MVLTGSKPQEGSPAPSSWPASAGRATQRRRRTSCLGRSGRGKRGARRPLYVGACKPLLQSRFRGSSRRLGDRGGPVRAPAAVRFSRAGRQEGSERTSFRRTFSVSTASLRVSARYCRRSSSAPVILSRQSRSTPESSAHESLMRSVHLPEAGSPCAAARACRRLVGRHRKCAAGSHDATTQQLLGHSAHPERSRVQRVAFELVGVVVRGQRDEVRRGVGR